MNDRRNRHAPVVLAALLASSMLAAPVPSPAQPADPLAAAFANPPQSARPRVWWHWLNGNVTLTGIDQDLAWMQRVGIGGVQTFDGSQATPQVVETRVPYLSPAWRKAMRHAVETARRKGLEFTIASSPGWSETGGPWVKPEQAMKKLVWSELDVSGGRPVSVTLPEPPAVTGPFADMPAAEAGKGPVPDRFYRDARVVAYRLPPAESFPRPAITASNPIAAGRLTDGDRTRPVRLELGPDGAWIQFAYEQPQTMRAATVTLRAVTFGPILPVLPKGSIQASDDGRTFRTVATLPAMGNPQQTVAFPETSARVFRLVLEKGYSPLTLGGRSMELPAPPSHEVLELDFQTGARVDRFEDKAGFTQAGALDAYATPAAAPSAIIAASDVIDITDRVSAGGKLDWTPPPGRWRILRLGWSLTGKLVHPASPEGAGLEVDKLNRRHMRDYADTYLGELQKAVGEGGLGPGGIGFLLNDSYEAGAANWTDDILAQFAARRGYDPLPFLPVLTGKVVQSAEASDRFLWDFRRTLADLIADAHYGELSRILRTHGMGRYGESHEGDRGFVGDGMEVKKTATVPMGAAWVEGDPARFMPDLQESASVAHLYGQNIVAAESFTVSDESPFAKVTTYGMAPEQLKPLADAMMANGVNRFVIHTSVHQPSDQPGPGVGLGVFGQWFTRKETWAEMAGGWTRYLARSSAMLQQGRFAADVAWFYGEDDNIAILYATRRPAVPAGFAFDFVNADALRSLLRVEDGKLTAPSGAAYRMLVLDTPARRMTLPTLRRIAELVDAGAVVVGRKPVTTPSLGDDEAAFHRLADRLWASGKIPPSIAAAREAIDLVPDAIFPDASSLSFVHRKLPDADIYYVTNLSDAAVTTTGRFRVAGKAPQVWRADDGAIRDVSYRIDGATTQVPLALGPRDSLFVMFQRPADQPMRTVPEPSTAPLMQVAGPWGLEFPQPGAAPLQTVITALGSWTADPREAVKYFSGVATYTTAFRMPRRVQPGERILIDLGAVKNVARVRVNGREAGIAWKAPFRVDVTDAVRAGRNTLSVEVANLWPNRLIGDKQPGATRTHLATRDTFKADSPLLPSGLLGPVQVLREAHADLEK